MVSQNILHSLYFKLEAPNKNLILKNKFIYPCIVFKLLVFICATLLCARKFRGVLTSHSHQTCFLHMFVELGFGNKLFLMT